MVQLNLNVQRSTPSLMQVIFHIFQHINTYHLQLELEEIDVAKEAGVQEVLEEVLLFLYPLPRRDLRNRSQSLQDLVIAN